MHYVGLLQKCILQSILMVAMNHTGATNGDIRNNAPTEIYFCVLKFFVTSMFTNLVRIFFFLYRKKLTLLE